MSTPGVDRCAPLSSGDATCLYNNNYRFVGRYVVNTSDTGCELSPSEVSAIHGANLKIVSLVSVQASTDMSVWDSPTGYSDGSNAATAQDAYAASEGGTPILYVDLEPTGFSTSTNGVPLQNYLCGFISGVRSVNANLGVGVYAASAILSYLCGTNYASLPFWWAECASDGAPGPSCGYAIEQTQCPTSGVPVDSCGNYDIDEAFPTSYGQW